MAPTRVSRPDTSPAEFTFGRSVRRRRLALDLTQAALARRASCSTETVKRIEHDERRPSRRMAAALADALELSGDDRTHFVDAATGGFGDEARLSPDDRPARSVPTWTPLVGRQPDLAALRRMLTTHRVVTIHGPGGVGKSRLAAELVADRDPALTVWVEFPRSMAHGSAESLIARAMHLRDSAAMGPRDSILARIGSDPWLLVLDNCEHVVDEIADFLRQLFPACPEVRVLVASRALTGIAGEARWSLSGLAVPGRVPVSPSGPLPEAMELFLLRARDAVPSTACDEVTVGPIASICRTLDGLPLAIELAAARVDLYPPPTLVQRIDADVGFLRRPEGEGDARYRDLADMVHWSLNLLAPAHRAWLSALSTFTSSFDVVGAKAVACPECDLADFENGLRALLDASLIARNEDASRFHLLETIRAVAEPLLDEAERTTVRDRHARWCAHWAGEVSERLWGADAPVAIEELRQVEADLDAALDRSCVSGDAETALVLAGSLCRYWEMQGRLADGVAAVTRALGLGSPSSPSVRVRAENGLGTLVVVGGDVPGAEAIFARAVAAASKAGLRWDEAYATQYLGLCATYADDVPRARALLTRSAQLAESTGDAALLGWSFLLLASLEMWDENLTLCQDLLRRARDLLSAAGEHEGLGWVFLGEAAVLRLVGRGAESWHPLRSAWEHLIALGGAGWATSVLAIEAGNHLAMSGDTEGAAELLVLSDELRRVVGATHPPMLEAWRSHLVAMVHGHADDGAADESRPRGPGPRHDVGRLVAAVGAIVSRLQDPLGGAGTPGHIGGSARPHPSEA